MTEGMNRRDFLKTAAATAGVAALGGRPLAALAREAKEKKRPLIYGAGMIWGMWLGYPQKEAFAYDEKQMDMLKSLGATVTSATFDWVDREPQKGKWDWTYPDHSVEAAHKRGLKQVGYVGNTPPWAMPAGVDPKLGYRFPPRDDCEEDFKNYCRKVASRYKGRVEMFQFWNEPNGCGWVNNGCANGDQQELYTHWLQIAYTALKEGNPNCKVAGGALDYNAGVKNGWQYVDGMYKYGAKNHFDAISIHPYGGPLNWDAPKDTYRVMKDHGDGGKEVWITEYGWNDSSGEDAAKNIREVLTRLATPEFEFVTVAEYLCVTDLPGDGHQYGLCDRDLHPRPVALAFKELAKKGR